MTADVAVGLLIVGVLAGSLAVLLARQQRGSRQLADHRAAVRLAESVLEDLREGKPPPASDGVRVERLSDPSPLPGRVWIAVTVTRDSRVAMLTGLVRDDYEGILLPTSRPTTRRAP